MILDLVDGYLELATKTKSFLVTTLSRFCHVRGPHASGHSDGVSRHGPHPRRRPHRCWDGRLRCPMATFSRSLASSRSSSPLPKESLSSPEWVILILGEYALVHSTMEGAQY